MFVFVAFRCVCRGMCCCCVFFFFKQKTAYEMRISDWSSDVCSSDLNFSVDRDGFVVNPSGDKLQVFPPSTGGNFDVSRIQDLKLSLPQSPPIDRKSTRLNSSH